ncbi:MAG: type II toxin-antitoxin system ParD family antitoxin, partial [bacterium]|nr:type II toxin-antitoxin system ParD family antitoxin [bacterium]
MPATITVTLSPELESFVNSRVTSGRYASVSEVIQQGLRILEEHEVMLKSSAAD